MRRKLPRPISSTSRKPSVVMRPVRAPLPSSSALMPIVVPWMTSRQSGEPHAGLIDAVEDAVEERARAC